MTTLADKLRAGTAPSHRMVEHTAFVRDLLAGRIDRPSYCALLRNLHTIYAALEPALQQHASHRAVAPLHNAALYRAAPLAEDLVFLHGARWHDELPALPAALAYAHRVHELARDNPALLVAHAYVRYLGDLSGGQLVRRAVTRSLGLPDAAGTAFYDFGPPAAVTALAAQFRRGLVAVAGAVESEADIVDEANDGFRRHERLFDELERARAAPR